MLAVRGLRKTFGDYVAIRDVTFDVPSGAMVGFLGSNGAGKTTTMRMIMGIMEPDRGEVLFDGQPITRDQRAQIGYMPEERGLYPKQNLEGQLAYLAELKGVPRRRAVKDAREYLDRFGLGDRRKDLLESLSLGNQQRVQIIASIMSQPNCLVLDEPFSGLDPKAIDDMSEVLRDVTRQGVPVLFSSHQLDMVDRLCDEMVALSGGEVKAAGDLESLTRGRPLRYRAVLRPTDWPGRIDGVQVIEHVQSGDHDIAIFETHDPGAAHRLMRDGVQKDVIVEFSRVVPTLSEIYQEVVS